MATENGSPISLNSRFLIVNPENGGVLDLLKFWAFNNQESGAKFLESAHDGVIQEGLLVDNTTDHRWVIIVSIIVRKIITVFGKPMEWTGYLVEFILNLLSLNGNFLGLLYNIFHGNVAIPQRDSETFISAIGHLDGRIDLYQSEMLLKETIQPEFWKKILQVGAGSQVLMDLCILASKLAYENANVVRNVVNLHWKMHFVDFYNCWNDYQKEMSTQVFILCNKEKDADLILISFRGTEPFDADDWSTDFDYSWYEIPELGKVHMGFLEALGLGNRMNTSTFREQLQGNNIWSNDFNARHGLDKPSESDKPSGTDENIVPTMGEMTAYYAVRSKLKSLLEEHKNAKFVVTGHSLGGALAILFPTVLVLHKELEVMGRMLGVYTYGQPRVGNEQIGKFMEAHLEHPIPKYFRVVYCNDLVPRLPYDNKTFLYKHFGICLYYNSLYIEQKVEEEPNRNYFGWRYLIPDYLNAIWELFRSFIIGYLYGPEYKESLESILLRIVGLAIPGLSAHSPVDYVNSVRLGRMSSVENGPYPTGQY
ncbi:alpha/beta-Hydrolases superfamily protein [Abeliophyllum distichum]|uniref:Alpha/beta-Hydrolases superfamily protein n=1 Tax=Abeliophyllum distichum TaxID=126358 RepID=A0ABD1VNZ7_9LAMI